MISLQEYQERRAKLAKQLQKNSVALVPAAFEVLRNGDAHYRFRQDSDFYYLTGFTEPDACLLIYDSGESILFNRTRNLHEEQWTGKRLGQEGAKLELGMQQAFPIDTFEKELPQFLLGKEAVYYSLSRHKHLEQSILGALKALKSQVRKGLQAPSQLCDLEPLISEMRLIKSPAELELMREASRVSVQAHLQAMQSAPQFDFEYQLEAQLAYVLGLEGCREMAYDPIVGSGENACVLHYTANNKTLQKDQLVLIDAGGEFQGYAADITRTFPVSGRFSAEQKNIYNLVLKAQKAAIALIKPGIFWHELQQVIVHILTEGLCELGILQGDVQDLISKEAYRPFYMHNFGHWLGLDVHDSGAYKIKGQWRSLQAGMVLTVEPGLYLGTHLDHIEPRWRGIGVRIEDDVVVTETGHEVLTAALPSEVEAIEALMRGE